MSRVLRARVLLSMAGLLTAGCWLDDGAQSPPRSAEQAAAYVGATLDARHGGSAVAVAARVGYWEGTLQWGPMTMRVDAVSNAQGQVLLREIDGQRAWWLTGLVQQGSHVVGALHAGGGAADERNRLRFFGSAQAGRLDGALRAATWSLADWLAEREPATEAEAFAFGQLSLERRDPPAALTPLPTGVIVVDSATQTELTVDVGGNLEGSVLGCVVAGAIRLSPSVGGVAEIAAQSAEATACQGRQTITGSAVARPDGSFDVTLTDGVGAFALRLPAR
jgi:hypothetical protein